MKTKLVSLIFLGMINTFLVVSGLWYATLSVNTKNTVHVFGVNIPAYLLGFLVIYISVRSYIKLFNLSKTIWNPTQQFSWSNFAWSKK